MNARLSSIEVATVLVQYKTHKISPLGRVKIRLKCALEAILHFGNMLQELVAIKRDPANAFLHRERRLDHGQQVKILVKCVFNPHGNLFSYAENIGEAYFISNYAFEMSGDYLY